MVYSDPNNANSIVYQHTLLSYQLKASHWNFSRAATLHLCNMADRGEKLQQPHCYHPFSDSRDTYLTKNHYENYSPKMVPTNPTGSWTTGRFHFNIRKAIFKLTLVNGGWGISYEIALRWMPQDLTVDKSTLVQVVAWCRQATSHYLSQCWLRSMSPNGVTRPQWVKPYV